MTDSVALLQAKLPLLQDQPLLDALNQLADLLVNRDIYLMLKTARQAERLALELGDEKSLAESLLNIGQAKFRFTKYQEAELSLEKALALFQKLNDKFGQARCLLVFGNTYELQSQLPNALRCYLTALSMLETLESHHHKIKCLYYLGNVNSILGDYAAALEYYVQAHHIALSIDDEAEINATSGKIGDALQKLRRFEESLKYYQQALHGIRQMADKHSENGILINISEVYIHLEQYELARSLLEEGFLLARELGDRRQEVNSLIHFAQLYNAIGEFELARQHYEQGLTLSRMLNIPREETLLQLNFGEHLIKTGEHSTALLVLEQALSLAENSNIQPEICRAHELLASSYKQLDNFKQALMHYEQFHQLNQKMFGENQIKRIEASLMQQEIEKTRQLTAAQRAHNDELQRINLELAAINRQNQELIEQVQYQAKHDDLTGLPNRRLFEDRLQQAVLYAARYKQTIAVLLIDLDGFKFVNDTFGHDAGDELLIQVTARFKNKLRQSDTIARLGGDEFSVIVNGLTKSQGAAVVADGLLKSLQPEFIIKTHKVSIGASIGISLYPQNADNMIALQKQADIAMYDVKRNGKCDIRFYSPNLKLVKKKPVVNKTIF